MVEESLTHILDAFQKDGQSHKTEKVYKYTRESGLRFYNQWRSEWVDYVYSLFKADGFILPILAMECDWFSSIYDYLTNSIIITRAHSYVIHTQLHDDPDYLKFTNEMIADYIDPHLSIRAVSHESETSDQLVFVWQYGDNQMEQPLDSDSSGLRRFLQFIYYLYPPNVEGKTIIFDDFGKGWHPSLTHALLRKCLKTPAQYILTTHDVSLMDQGIRKDAIYFMDRDRKRGNSIVYILSDFKLGKLKNYGELYLSGRFGGVYLTEF